MNFVAINFSEYFKSTREEQMLYIFLTTPDEVEKYVEIMQSNSSGNSIYRHNVEILNIFDPELQLINTKLMIKNKLKEMLPELKKFRQY